MIIFEFCDWAEKQIHGNHAGAAQEVLLRYGYRLWRLKEFILNCSPLSAPITKGFEMLVAVRN